MRRRRLPPQLPPPPQLVEARARARRLLTRRPLRLARWELHRHHRHDEAIARRLAIARAFVAGGPLPFLAELAPPPIEVAGTRHRLAQLRARLPQHQWAQRWRADQLIDLVEGSTGGRGGGGRSDP